MHTTNFSATPNTTTSTAFATAPAIIIEDEADMNTINPHELCLCIPNNSLLVLILVGTLS